MKCLTTHLDIDVSNSMASNSEWKEDNQLENDLGKYVSQNFKRSEILDFVTREIFLNILGVQQPWTDDFATSVYII